jgi:hypothetical protein
MARHKVDDSRHLTGLQLVKLPEQCSLAAERGAHPDWIADVVAMAAARCGPERRREVDVADAELGEIRDDRRGGI